MTHIAHLDTRLQFCNHFTSRVSGPNVKGLNKVVATHSLLFDIPAHNNDSSIVGGHGGSCIQNASNIRWLYLPLQSGIT